MFTLDPLLGHRPLIMRIPTFAPSTGAIYDAASTTHSAKFLVSFPDVETGKVLASAAFLYIDTEEVCSTYVSRRILGF